ncbi:hypothetical protein J3R30DRAFT_3296554 [Lentinula aciculospora]|uniref:Protoporphyrinogen oxidase n=1 Tax=Lentinula aciculospora TaxID=153920 RepID=A0A9W9A4A1_9AGAR|nr:hypothetical protein J3R30DRAFT_3296554 [Lentinula aciculospora]
MNRRIVVLGGGLTGLSSAFHLSRRFPEALITLIEKSPRLGGWIFSERVQVHDGDSHTAEILLESGPRTLRPNAKSVLELIHLLGLKNSVITTPITSSAAKNRYLQIPETQGLITLPNSLTSVFSPPMRTLFLPHVLREPVKRRNRPSGITDESVDSFMNRRFGPVFARTFGSALVHGIYAADSRQLSVRAAFPSLWAMEDRGWGSVVRGALLPAASTSREDYDVGDIPDMMKDVSVYSFTEGIGMLTGALATHLQNQINVKLLPDTSVSSLGVVEDGQLQIKLANEQMINPTHIVSTLPLPVLDDLLSPTSSLPHLTSNPASSVVVLNLVFQQTEPRLHPAGFGYLIPRPPSGYSLENPGILGTVFDSSALSAQDSNVANFTKMTVMMGGPNPITPAHTSIDTVLKHLSVHLTAPEDFLKVLPEPLYARTQHHVDCIPTPTPGHLERMDVLKKTLAKGVWSGRLEVVGAGVRGVSLGDCVESGKRVGQNWMS